MACDKRVGVLVGTYVMTDARLWKATELDRAASCCLLTVGASGQ